jgi:hypothetical protein
MISSFKLAADLLLEIQNNVIVLCGDGFMDFIHRLKSKILKILKN